MMKNLFVIIVLLHLSVNLINSVESPLKCWHCDVTVQSSEKNDIFLDDCDAQFDFTQHKQEECTGKCWKSVDLIDPRYFENRTLDQPYIKYRTGLKFKSSRRCFSADELLRAAELGMNTSDGCRQVRKDHQKIKEICFCSDQDFCNNSYQLTNTFSLQFISMFFIYLNKNLS